MTMNLNIKGINFDVLTDEQKQQMAILLGVDLAAIEVKQSKKKEINNLKMVEGSETLAIDAYSGEQFDITTLTEEELTNAKKTGLSPESLRKMNEGLQIKASMKGRTINRGPRQGVSAGEQIRQIITTNVDNITEEHMTAFLDKDKSRQLFSLAYPLFIEIPKDSNDEERKWLRKVNGSNRFSPIIWEFSQIPGKSFFMTNDLYHKNIEKIAKYFEKQFSNTETIIKENITA